jgi:RHS repeat-associated protein
VITDGAAQTTFALAGGPTQKFTGKERDAETGLDYFGARYLASGQGRFVSPDSKMMSGRHIEFPQKWNQYGFVQNNPLSRIDPDGHDDYKVLAPDSRIKGNWATARRTAEANGHTFRVFEGKDASVREFVKALGDKDSRVVYVGHTTHDESGKISGLALSDGIVSSEGAQVQTKDSDLTVMPVDVFANTVCILACDSVNIDKGFQKTDFYGVDSGRNKVTSVDAMTPAAAAFAGAHSAKHPAPGKTPAGFTPDPIKRANEALRRNQRQQDLDGDKVVKP